MKASTTATTKINSWVILFFSDCISFVDGLIIIGDLHGDVLVGGLVFLTVLVFAIDSKLEKGAPLFNQDILLGIMFSVPSVVFTVLRLADFGFNKFFIGSNHIPEHSKHLSRVTTIK